LTGLVSRIEALEQEREQMLARFRAVQRENFDFEERSREIERENNNLANLYVASYQLHSTLDLREITQIIVEILLNFVGARTFAVLLLDETRGVLRPLAAEGIARDQVPAIAMGQGPVGAVVATGKALFDEAGASAGRGLDLERPLIVSPLRIKDKVVGAIVVWEFLRQKTELAEVDHEILNLLAAHAAAALQGAKLAADSRSPLELWGAVDLV
jgi:transcriptional regulator with GAF, ATPase, and Fis domain